LLIALFTIFIDARLVPLQHVGDEPLAINAVSSNSFPIISPVLPAMNRVANSPIIPSRHNISVCYPVVGCFDNNDPFNNAGLEVPQSPEFIDTQFLLFTQEASTQPEFLFYNGNDQSITGSSLNSSRWLRIVVHGFVNNRNSIWINPLKEELLKLGDVRIILNFLIIICHEYF
jgi:hypothetical protein